MTWVDASRERRYLLRTLRSKHCLRKMSRRRQGAKKRLRLGDMYEQCHGRMGKNIIMIQYASHVKLILRFEVDDNERGQPQINVEVWYAD